MAINNYSVSEANNLGLGQAGAVLETGTTAISGKNVIAFTLLEDTVFTTLTPKGSSLYIGDSNNNGDTSDSITFPQGVTIFGNWSLEKL